MAGKVFSREALEERAQRLAGPAMTVIESILEMQDLVCPECEHVLKVAKADKLAQDTAFKLVSMIGAGPVQRQRVETDGGSKQETIEKVIKHFESLSSVKRIEIAQRLIEGTSVKLIKALEIEGGAIDVELVEAKRPAK